MKRIKSNYRKIVGFNSGLIALGLSLIHIFFLLPPSVEELERRLRGRGTETEASILERLDTAKKELAEQEKFCLLYTSRCV